MNLVILAVIVLFFVLPIVGGFFAFFTGLVRPRLMVENQSEKGYHPLNPFYKSSPFDFS